MGIFLLTIKAFVHSLENAIMKKYSEKHGNGGLFLSAIISFFSMLYFFISDKNGLYFPPELWIYGGVSCLLYATGFYSMYVALQCGSFIMTRMISSFAIIFPMLYGIIFLKEPTTVFTYIGIVLIFFSLIIKNIGSADKPAEKSDSSGKWLIATIVSTVANGFISIVSRMQQIRFDNKCTNEFLIISLGGSFLALLIAGLITDRGSLGHIIKKGSLYGLFAGVCNGISNYLGVFVYLFIPISLVSPLSSGIAFVVSFFFTTFVFREKFTKQQLIGMFIGIVAVIILNL